MKKFLLSISIVFVGHLALKAQGCNFTYTVSALTVSFTDATPWGSCAAMPLWNFGDPASGVNNTSQLATPNHTFSSAGTYTVCLSSGHGAASICAVSFATKCTTITVSGTSGIKAFESDLKAFSVSPNPSNAEFAISYSLKSDAVVKLDVFNLLGEKVTSVVNES